MAGCGHCGECECSEEGCAREEDGFEGDGFCSDGHACGLDHDEPDAKQGEGCERDEVSGAEHGWGGSGVGVIGGAYVRSIGDLEWIAPEVVGWLRRAAWRGVGFDMRRVLKTNVLAGGVSVWLGVGLGVGAFGGVASADVRTAQVAWSTRSGSVVVGHVERRVARQPRRVYRGVYRGVYRAGYRAGYRYWGRDRVVVRSRVESRFTLVDDTAGEARRRGWSGVDGQPGNGSVGWRARLREMDGTVEADRAGLAELERLRGLIGSGTKSSETD